MSHAFALKATNFKKSATRADIAQELQKLKYNKANTFSGGALSAKSAAAPPLANQKPNGRSGGSAHKQQTLDELNKNLSDDDIVKAVAQAVTGRLRDAATSYDGLLDEKNSVQATATFTFTWRKPLSEAEIRTKQADAAKSGKVYEADSTPEAPIPVSFSVPTLNRMFGNKIDFSKEQYLLSAYIESAHSTAPYPLDFTIHNVQGAPIEREFSSDGTASTLTLMPGEKWSGNMEIYRLSDVDAKNLYKHGNANMKSELDSLVVIDNSPIMLVPPNQTLGQILKANEKEITGGGTLEMIPIVNLYAVDENIVATVLERFNNEVLSGLKTTSFADIEGTLSRADRTASDASRLEFADAEDAAGLGTRAALDAAHKAKHQVTVKVRLHAINPANLKSHDASADVDD